MEPTHTLLTLHPQPGQVPHVAAAPDPDPTVDELVGRSGALGMGSPDPQQQLPQQGESPVPAGGGGACDPQGFRPASLLHPLPHPAPTIQAAQGGKLRTCP